MRLVRFGPNKQERPGLLDKDGRVRDLSEHVSDLGGDYLSTASLHVLSRLNPESLPLVNGRQRLGPPVAHVGKFIAIGLNYADHAAETNVRIPSEPVVFLKATSCIAGPYDEVVIPRGSKKTDWEVELGLVIGTPASYVAKEQALQHVAGYVVVNDVSERHYQLERGGTWDKGKGCDTFGPIGPWLVTPDEISDVQDLPLWLEVNGVRKQSGSTSAMIFDVATIVSYVSEFMSLYPGDVIATGTPPGVGLGQKPEAQYLKPGDVVRLGISGLGEQQQTFVAWESTQRPETVPHGR